MYHFMVTLALALSSGLVKIQLFQNMVMLHYQIKGNEIYCNMEEKKLPLHTPLTSECDQNRYLSEKWYDDNVAYQL